MDDTDAQSTNAMVQLDGTVLSIINHWDSYDDSNKLSATVTVFSACVYMANFFLMQLIKLSYNVLRNFTDDKQRKWLHFHIYAQNFHT